MKQKWILHGPPNAGILVKYVFELRRTTGEKKFHQHTVTLSSRGGGGLGLNGTAIKRRTIFAASLRPYQGRI